jgi:hypothetical protein
MKERPTLSVEKFCYVPTVRFKRGECLGLCDLAPDVVERIRPCFVLPPPGEGGDFFGQSQTAAEVVSGTGHHIAKAWPFGTAFLEPRFLFEKLEGCEWLPRMFDAAQARGTTLIPVAGLTDLAGPRAWAFKASLASECDVKVALRVSPSDVDDVQFNEIVSRGLSSMQIGPDGCSIFLDVSQDNSVFDDPQAVADVVLAAVERLVEFGGWRHIVLRGSNYPQQDPAEEGATVSRARGEWLAWLRTLEAGLVFGDFGADSPVIKFPKGGGRIIPHRHLRYATPQSWLVVRGKAAGRTSVAMRDVCTRIVSSGQFAGRDFSAADQRIFGVSTGHTEIGTPWQWRELDTCHHITRVVADLGGILGFAIKRRKVVESEQVQLEF